MASFPDGGCAAQLSFKRPEAERWNQANSEVIQFSWGAISAGIAGATNFNQVTGVRFLLGAFEAGLFPGLVYYLTFWVSSIRNS